MGNFLVRYSSRVVIYNLRAVVKLAPGLVVGDDLSLRGRGFKSCSRILDGHDIFQNDLL